MNYRLIAQAVGRRTAATTIIKTRGNRVGGAASLYPYSNTPNITTNISSRRCITTRAARSLLGFPTKASKDEMPITLKELRHAYFAAAKQCHPDVASTATADDNDDNEEDTEEGSTDQFLQLTKAYELLQAAITQDGDLLLSTISKSEEEEFRIACQSELGVAAEIVEECKRTPIFRRWLNGGSDGSRRWKMFFLSHGGLAPKLRPNAGALAAGKGAKGQPSHKTRRKRK